MIADAPPECGACLGTGLVAPSPFDELTSWPEFVAGAAALAAAPGFEPGGSALLSGLTRPRACPRCRGEEDAVKSTDRNAWAHGTHAALARSLPPRARDAEAIENLREFERAALEKFGWYSHAVVPYPWLSLGVNYHTHGLPELVDYPDVQVILPMSLVSVKSLLQSFVARLKEGVRPLEWEVFELPIGCTCGKDCEVVTTVARMLPSKESGRDVLRIVLADSDGLVERETMNAVWAQQYEQELPLN